MTITTLRPSTDFAKANVTMSTGTQGAAVTDDAPDDDATYARVVAGTQYPAAYLHMNMTDLGALTANQRILRVKDRARVRMHTSVPGYGASVQMRPVDHQSGLDVPGSPVQQEAAGASDDFFTSNPSTVQAKEGFWRNHPPPLDGSEWTRNIINRTIMHVAWFYTPNVTKENLRLTEVYLDVDVRTQPTVTGTAVAGSTTTTRPTVTWVYNPNADGDPQVAYRVKIFTSAVYGAVGFDPETSPAAWDSGIISGPGSSTNPSVDLVNGGTYKAYVKAAQDFNGENWFSSWDISGAFTIGVTAPATPTMTITPDPTVPYIRNIIQVTNNLNVLSYDNATFETTIGNWANLSNSTVVASATQAKHGTQSMRMTATAGANMSATLPTGTSGIRVKGSTSYTATAFFRAGTTARSVRVNIRWYDKNGTIIGSVVNGTSVADSNANFNTQATLTATSPSNAVYATMEVEVLAAGAAEIHYVDEADFHAGSSTTWSLPGTIGEASTIIERSWGTIGRQTNGNLAHPQLFGGGEEEHNANGFFTTGTFSTVEFDTNERFAHEGSLRWRIRDTTAVLTLGWPNTTDVNPTPVYPLAVVPGRIYSFSLRAKASQSFNSQITLQAVDKDGTNVGSSVNGGAIAIGTGWAEFKVEGWTVPAGAAWVRISLANSSSVEPRDVWVDCAQWFLRSTVPAVIRQPSGQPTVWTAVRGAALGELVSTDEEQSITVIDREVPPGYTVVYRARNFTSSIGGVSSDSTPYVPTMLDPPGQGIYTLGDPQSSTDRLQVDVTGIEESIHEESQIFYPVRPAIPQGFGQRPVAVSDFVGGQDGSMTLAVVSEDEWFLLLEMLSRGNVLWLVYPDHGARYVKIGDRGITRRGFQRGGTTDPNCEPSWRRVLTLPFTEVGRPP